MTVMMIAYTDGACKGNGKAGGDNAGGYGVHIVYPNGDVLDIWGGDKDTTNNRMELQAAIVALERTPADTPLQIWTDSNYVKNGITKWITTWKNKNWCKADGKPVLNQALWQKLDQLSQNRHIDWQWVKGHAGHQGNEQADKLANLGVAQAGEQFIPCQAIHHQEQQYFEHLAQLDDGLVSDTDTQTSPKPSKSPKKSTTKTNIHQPFERHFEQNPQYNGDTSGVNTEFWAVLPDPINKHKPERQLIMDTETTGFEDQKGDRIVEVGIVELVGRKFTGQQLHVYINPDKHMDEEVIKVHGISNEFLSDKPRFGDIANHLYEFMKGAELIAHNASFDMKFLQVEFANAGFDDFLQTVEVTDSLVLARKLYPGQKNSLDALVRRLDVGKRDRTFHGALLDSEILAEVYLAMTSGQIALTIEDDNQETQETQIIHFNDLSEYASCLVKSKHDDTADSIWRQAMLKA